MAEVFALEQSYPNPFNQTTTIRYGLARTSEVHLSVYNTLGQQVARLVQGEQDAGYHDITFDGSTLSSGVYFYRLEVRPVEGGQYRDFVHTRKLALIK